MGAVESSDLGPEGEDLVDDQSHTHLTIQSVWSAIGSLIEVVLSGRVQIVERKSRDLWILVSRS